ncbi:MAG: redoxin domain-containing protein [Halovenus sp.]
MIEDGERAPAFELPAVVDGDIEQVALGDALGRDILVIVFYPGDFNPACSDDTTDLDAFDSLGLQADVTALAVSSDSVYSHRAFADAYDLRVPLLADVYGAVAEAYGVAVEDERAGYRTRRAVVVIDHGGRVEYTWVADALETLPDVDELRDVVARVGGDGSGDRRDAVDDEELEEITSELESQTEAAMARQAAREAVDETSPSDDADEGATPDDTDAADIEGDLDADDIELDLADPTEGDSEETETDADPDGRDEEDPDRESDSDADEDPDVGTGDHGVPDSL